MHLKTVSSNRSSNTASFESCTDLPALKNLYAQYSESMFSVDLFTQGIYIGAHEAERIIAAGGTYALAATYRIAVLGNILTAPEAHGQGYASAITATLITILLQQHFSAIVLNVFEDNHDAIHMYRRLGFQTHQRMLTGIAISYRYKHHCVLQAVRSDEL